MKNTFYISYKFWARITKVCHALYVPHKKKTSACFSLLLGEGQFLCSDKLWSAVCASVCHVHYKSGKSEHLNLYSRKFES